MQPSRRSHAAPNAAATPPPRRTHTAVTSQKCRPHGAHAATAPLSRPSRAGRTPPSPPRRRVASPTPPQRSRNAAATPLQRRYIAALTQLSRCPAAARRSTRPSRGPHAVPTPAECLLPAAPSWHRRRNAALTPPLHAALMPPSSRLHIAACRCRLSPRPSPPPTPHFALHIAPTPPQRRRNAAPGPQRRPHAAASNPHAAPTLQHAALTPSSSHTSAGQYCRCQRFFLGWVGAGRRGPDGDEVAGRVGPDLGDWPS